MNVRSKRLGAAAAGLMVAVTGLTVVQAPAASAATSCKSGTHWKACSTITQRVPVSFVVGYRDSFQNGLSQQATGNCAATTSKTVSFGVSVGVKAEVKAAIFASMEVSLSADISTSMATGYTGTFTFPVKAKTTVYCDRGVYRENVKGTSTYSWYGGGAGTTRQSWTASAPSRAQWRIYPV
ncbi:hypothetical protein [Kribbella sp. DT2]|uniref:hypothetical protein n=1 Tax=Kribbella sp. DT2 TaxID=3393427 RepID=UPI003CF2D825